MTATSRRLSVGVSRVRTASCRIRADDPLWSETLPTERMLKVFNSVGALIFYGPVISDNEEASGQGAHVDVVAADLMWRLSKRYVGKDVTGTGITYTAQDSGAIAYSILAAANSENPTGIGQGVSDAFVTRTITYLWKKSLDAVAELGAIQNSYEWALRYTDGTPPTVLLDLLVAVGDDKTATLFLEYGTGLANCSSYGRARSADTLADKVWAIGSSNTMVADAFDTGQISSRGLYEDVVTFGEISSLALLDALAAAHVAVRARPRTLVRLTPFALNAPRYGVDWADGDLATARVIVNDSVRVDGVCRVWSADIDIDEFGNERPAISLVPE